MPHSGKSDGSKRMADKKVWLVTGAGRAVCVDIDKAASRPVTPCWGLPATPTQSQKRYANK